MKATGLYNRLCNKKLLWNAWLHVRANGSAGGLDEVSVENYKNIAESEIDSILAKLKDFTYLPQPYKKVSIPKDNKDFRTLGLLCVGDKIVQQAMHQLLYPIIDSQLSSSCYAYRHEKGAVGAVKYTRHLLTYGKFEQLVSCDIRQYFDNINHETLLQMLQSLIADKHMLNFISLCIKMGRVKSGNRWEDVTLGVPQGSVISPLLANLYLTPLDKAMLERKFGYVRYADDFVVLAKTLPEAAQAAALVKETVSALHLNLKNVPEIISIEKPFVFLGIEFLQNNISISQKKKDRIKEKISLACSNENHWQRVLKKSLNGIKAFYGQIFKEEELLFIDEILLKALQQKISNNSAKIKSKKALLPFLEGISFVTHDYESRKTKLLTPDVGHEGKVAKPAKPHPKEIIPEKIIAKRKKMYRKLESQSMELIVNTFGTFIGKSQNHVYVKTREKPPERIPLVNLRQISILSDGISLSSDLIQICTENEITIAFFNRTGKHYASLSHPNSTDTTVWTAQMLALNSPKSISIAKLLIDAKIRNQVNLIKYFHKYHKTADSSFAELCKEKIKLMPPIRKEISLKKNFCMENYRQQLLSIEGRSAAIYWELVTGLIDDDSDFKKREHRGAKDLVNALLNYGYSILYARIWQAILKAKLNPYISFLHVPDSNKPVLSFDIIEMFRQQAVDRVVISLLQKNEKLEISDGLLTQETRAKLVENINERLHRYEKYRAKSTRLSDIIIQQTSDLAKFITGENKTFKPYIAKW